MAFQSGQSPLLFADVEEQSVERISTEVRETIMEKYNSGSLLIFTEPKLSDCYRLYSFLGSALFFPEFDFDKKGRIISTPSGILQFCILESLLAIESQQPSDHDRLLESICSSALSNFKQYTGHRKHECNERMSSSCSTILPQAQQKLCLLLGHPQTLHFMRLWAFLSARGYLYPLDEKKIFSNMKISNKSSTGEFLKITSYSPLLSMEITNTSGITNGDQQRIGHLNSHLLHCVFQFRNVVTFFPDRIEVKVEIDNVRCDVSIYRDEQHFRGQIYRDEQHFPARICLQIGPQNGSVVKSISLPQSSQNPITGIQKVNGYEATYEAPKTVGFKVSGSTSTNVKIKNWGFELSAIEDSRAKMDWTLYDNNTQKAVFSNGPPKVALLDPKTWFTNRYSMASRAFTEEGGVVFAKDEYGHPVTWRFNRDLEGQTLKWIIEGSIWLTYWPNTDSTKFFQTKRHDFCQEFDLALASAFTSM